jgi:uncharacterized spore protein YtfJ
MLQATETPISVNPFEEVFKSIVDHADAKMVYGEPIRLENKTILPVAKVRYGFGGGAGGKKTGEQHSGGGGGGLVALPIGIIEITESQTRFLPITTSRAVLTALGIGFLLGLVLSKRRR